MSFDDITFSIFRIYPRNPACPQSEASLAQLSLEQRLEQQQIQERLRQQLPQQLPQPPQLQHTAPQQQQHVVPVVTSIMDPVQQIQTVSLSNNQSIQVTLSEIKEKFFFISYIFYFLVEPCPVGAADW